MSRTLFSKTDEAQNKEISLSRTPAPRRRREKQQKKISCPGLSTRCPMVLLLLRYCIECQGSYSVLSGRTDYHLYSYWSRRFCGKEDVATISWHHVAAATSSPDTRILFNNSSLLWIRETLMIHLHRRPWSAVQSAD